MDIALARIDAHSDFMQTFYLKTKKAVERHIFLYTIGTNI